MGNKSILIFGAGKIGRSFIGQLFGLSGYEIVFSDVDPDIVSALNHRKCYPVVIKGDDEETLMIPNVRAISGMDRALVAEEVSKASILAVSVGKNALEKIIPLIADGLKLRYKLNPASTLDIIIAENMRSAGKFIHGKLLNSLPEGYPFDVLVGLVETSIGKMVPIMQQTDLAKDPLVVFAEPYNDLILDKYGFKGEIPDVKGLSPKENIKAWVDRKAFIHNLGHATVAYFGSFKHPHATFIYEVLEDSEVREFAKAVMLHSALVLQSMYPEDFSLEDLELHIDDLLIRFQNRALRDTLFRVGQDVPRKLGHDDRFVGIIRLAISQGMEYRVFLKAMSYAFFFQATDENGSKSAQDEWFDQTMRKGLIFTLETVCGFNQLKDEKLIEELTGYYQKPEF